MMHKQFVINGRACTQKCGKCRLTVTQLQKCNEYDAQTICDKRSCLLSSNVAVPATQGADGKKYMQQQIFNDKQR